MHLNAAHFVHAIVYQLDNMELVKEQLYIGNAFSRSGLVGLAHVDRAPDDLFRFTPMLAQVRSKALPHGLVFAFGSKNELGLTSIYKDRASHALCA